MHGGTSLTGHSRGDKAKEEDGRRAEEGPHCFRLSPSQSCSHLKASQEDLGAGEEPCVHLVCEKLEKHYSVFASNTD